MSLKHTPGPWSQEYPNLVVSTVVDENDSDRTGMSLVVATIRQGLLVVEQDRTGCTGGNLSLIAAAPELLSACKLFELLSHKTLHETVWFDEFAHCVSVASAAIVKAEGR
jgi:hypothetical protein